MTIMKAYEIEIYPDAGDVCIAQEFGTRQTESAGQQFIRLSTDQIEEVCAWLRQSKTVAVQEKQGSRD